LPRDRARTIRATGAPAARGDNRKRPKRRANDALHATVGDDRAKTAQQ